MQNDDVIFETNNICVYHDGTGDGKTGCEYNAICELSAELARLYRLLEAKEDDGK